MSGHSIARVLAAGEPHRRPRRLEVDELLGVDRPRSARRRAPAPRNVSADEADSPASFQPLNAHTSAGARSPSGRRSQRSGCIPVHGSGRVARSRPPRAPSSGVVSVGGAQRAAPRRRGRRRLRVHAQGPADRADRARRTSRSSCATAQARCPRACSATPTCSPGASSAATSCACSGRVERFRDELQVEVRAIERAEDGRPGGVPPGRLPRPRRARRLPRAPRARGPRARATARCWSACSGDARAARRVAARAVHARRPPRLPRRAARAHRRGRRRSRSRPASCTRG